MREMSRQLWEVHAFRLPAEDHSDMDHEPVYSKEALSTAEALTRLHQDIESVLKEHQLCQKKRFSNIWHKQWLRDALHHESRYTTFCWTSAVAILACSFALFFAYIVDKSDRLCCLLAQGILLLLLLAINVYLVLRENKLRHSEMTTRILEILHQLKDASETCQWYPENYPHLCSPVSPCITLQWTYRDGKLVNLPWALLVRDDIVVIRPGQQAPGRCSPLSDPDAPELDAHQFYSPHNDRDPPPSTPVARNPLSNKYYIMRETPYLRNLKLVLDRSLDRPVTRFNQYRYLLTISFYERRLLPAMLGCTLAVSCLRYVYLHPWAGAGPWPEMFLTQLVSVSLPFLPLVFPAAWLLLTCVGTARIHAILHANIKQVPVDPFEDTDLTEPKHGAVDVSWKSVKEYFLKVLWGSGEIPSRSANLLHVLGSVTALCCVDKKGILSWPNPTAEKVFFLRNTSRPTKSLSHESVATGQGEQKQQIVNQDSAEEEKLSKSSQLKHDTHVQTVAEVLDLTHDHTSAFRLQFDDHTWKQYLNSLKPLGLAILLNTCNMETQEHYSQFCAHVTCEALHSENLVPVTNRRCLCELAKQIGFVDQAQDIFKLEEQLSTFRHVQPELVRRDIKFARSLPIAKLKFPFPHMVAVVVREHSRRNLQLMAQGTADIILDACIEFWDGYDLCPLTASDRKKIQDFYQRTSLTAYCTAFAYRPLTRSVNSKLSNVYLELPADSKHLYAPHRSPTPLAWDPRCRGILSRFHSTDSLLGNEGHEDDVDDVEGCFELQCNQVFIGMVTMQYQAQIDMVQLIEQLERACIRFVHFSKENELRSRVFSEKMGLESGWNCHISLLSERNRSDSGQSDSWPNVGFRLSSPSSLPKCCTLPNDEHADEAAGLLSTRSAVGNSKALSFSAPSAINLDFSQVKFEDETHDMCDESSIPQPEALTRSINDERVTSQDSMLVHSVDLSSQTEVWRSLSCLTDSTEQSGLNIDISNRAKLPRGIDKIRPHLEQIDNVPLLVSLFTDCTPLTTCEMLHIMQEYKEVVCVLGSAANADNMPIFLQADASFAVEPLYPQVCQKIPAFIPTKAAQGVSPVELNRMLNSIACSITFHREDPVSIFHLILEARHFMHSVTNSIQFWMCCVASISVVQVLAIIFMLPPIFSTGHIMWLVCIIVPLLSLSLVGKPTDPQVMHRATGKNECVFNTQVAIFILWCYGAKFALSCVAVLLVYVTVLKSECDVVTALSGESNMTCTVVYPVLQEEWGGWDQRSHGLLFAQHAALSAAVLFFVTISACFVHREYSLWVKSPHSNIVWLAATMITLLLQMSFFGISFFVLWSNPDTILTDIQVPYNAIIIGIISPFVIVSVNELIKREEIKVNVRYQKRARLEFGTKLGMNSPF
ncbi:transmembrane protein 94 isoform X3 [Schistocerca gregaria]|uniref:transmembrane protein 94 isoform X3 n=1 Tax=Schistocerca gregaria TaxID=7010 RepID=UPI00211EB0B8|nr:transmembrane protein 94 isoform X3 [Schistocerca gregaria]